MGSQTCPSPGVDALPPPGRKHCRALSDPFLSSVLTLAVFPGPAPLCWAPPRHYRAALSTELTADRPGHREAQLPTPLQLCLEIPPRRRQPTPGWAATILTAGLVWRGWSLRKGSGKQRTARRSPAACKHPCAPSWPGPRRTDGPSCKCSGSGRRPPGFGAVASTVSDRCGPHSRDPSLQRGGRALNQMGQGVGVRLSAQ